MEDSGQRLEIKKPEKKQRETSQWTRFFWREEHYQSFMEYLFTLQDQDYREFTMRLVPGLDQIIGVRMPVLRRLAFNICRSNFYDFLKLVGHDYYEERILNALVIGRAQNSRMNMADFQKYLSDFIPYIDNWSVCDTACAAFRHTRRFQPEMYQFLQVYLSSDKEFEQRFAIVMLLYHFIDDTYIDQVLDLYFSFNSNKYYVIMALAWAIAECYIRYRKKTLVRLKKERTRLMRKKNFTQEEHFLYKMILSKLMDSQRLSNEEKQMVHALRLPAVI